MTALLAAAGGPVAMLGHSSGAQVALHAAHRASEVRRLVLYEPPRLDAFTPAVRARLHTMLAAGSLEGIVATILLDVVAAAANPGLPPDAKVQLLQGLRRTPLWAAALRHARSIPTEVDSYATCSFDPAELRGFATPTVLLPGSSSGPVVRRWAEDLHARSAGQPDRDAGGPGARRDAYGDGAVRAHRAAVVD